MIRKGIILAGGNGSRLYPMTKAVTKQLLPVYDKPMIYYPLSVLMLAGIREVLIIVKSQDLTLFQNLFGDGSQFGMSLEYVVQPKPEGLAQAFSLANTFLAGAPSCLILGDNLFCGQGLKKQLLKANNDTKANTVFSYHVKDPTQYGVIDFDDEGNIKQIFEKPKVPSSPFAVTGLYFVDSDAPKLVEKLSPSDRGELEITDLLNIYAQRQQLKNIKLGRGMAWMDMGNPSSLLDASKYIEMLEQRQNLKIGCLEEIALDNNWVTYDSIKKICDGLSPSEYTDYLKNYVEK